MTDSEEFLSRTFVRFRSTHLDGPDMIYSKPPDKRGQGLDWAAIRREYEKRATPEELDGPFDERGNLKAEVVKRHNQEAKAENSRPARGVGRSPGVRGSRGLNWQEIKRLYLDEQLRVREIADRLGYSHQGVTNALKGMDVYDPGRDRGKRTRKPGPKPGEPEPPTPDDRVCGRGHKMPPVGECDECRKLRDREWQRRKYHERKNGGG